MSERVRIVPGTEAPTAALLGARVARDLAVLVRVEVEAAAWSHAEQLRRPVKGFGRLLSAVASLLTALAFVSWAAVLALDTMARPWLAGFVVDLGASFADLVARVLSGFNVIAAPFPESSPGSRGHS